MPRGKNCCALLLPHQPGAMHPMLSLANCSSLSASSAQAEIQTSMGPRGGPKLHRLPCVLDPSLELVIIPLAQLACPRASPSPLQWGHEKSAVKKGFDTKWVNWQTENDQLRPGTEDCEVGEVTKGKNTKRNRSWERTESLGNKHKGNSMTWPPTYRLKETHTKVACDTRNEDVLKMAWKTNYHVAKSVIIAQCCWQQHRLGSTGVLYLPLLS